MTTRQTPLYDQHLKLGATMVNFAGWLMPIHYGSQITEHNAVRNHVGIFDVSHMGVVDFHGNGTIAFFRFILANDIAKLKNGDALYTCLLNENGGVIDDLIVYRFSENYFRAVINAGCREKDFCWMEKQAKNFEVSLTKRDDLCMLALQGKTFLSELHDIFSARDLENITHLKPFQFCELSSAEYKNTFVSRTGYTGEPGIEIILPTEKAVHLWEALIAQKVQPCGLGARDTLRLEAGYNLYGTDMTENTSPLISNLAWTISFKDENRDFIGKKALLAEKATGVQQKLVGLILEDKGVLRGHQRVKIEGVGEGEITSGTFSPTLRKSIALARISQCDATEALVERRGEWLKARITKPRFL
ncbi:MAG: glycine cleavage system protein T [Gammaproteobacteria bacterium RIFCSPHIGHO2_12_FULL_38_14]|nr:MAG: glycine cleavage system protein T [Gammaproteobacteria bacterium RIFCSPHIGHO2_12_FULL_38_14]